MNPLVLAWLKIHQKPLLIGGAIAIAAGALTFCRPKPTPEPPKERRTADSLDITKPAYDSSRVATVKTETRFVQRSAQAARGDTTAAARADSIGRVADSLQRAAEAQHDTTSLWRAAAIARELEVAALTVSRDSARSALVSEARARLAADQRATLDSARRVAMEDLSGRLAKDLARASPPCRILWALSCPSRAATAVTTIIVTGAATYYITRK